MKTVYFAHAMTDYGTSREREDLAFLNDRYGEGAIINPNGKEWDIAARKAEETGQYPMAPFLQAVYESDVVAFRALPNDRVSPGVVMEVMAALMRNTPVVELRERGHGLWLRATTSLPAQRVYTREQFREWRTRR